MLHQNVRTTASSIFTQWSTRTVAWSVSCLRTSWSSIFEASIRPVGLRASDARRENQEWRDGGAGGTNDEIGPSSACARLTEGIREPIRRRHSRAAAWRAQCRHFFTVTLFPHIAVICGSWLRGSRWGVGNSLTFLSGLSGLESARVDG